MDIKVNKKIMVHAYKRNGWLYRVWEFPTVLETNHNFTVLSLLNTKVITSEKNSKRNFISKTLKNCFWFFFPNRWYNIIATFNDDKLISYYVNIASPFIYEEEAIKYYDFDLDIRMKSNSVAIFKVLDLDEFNENKKIYHYEKGVILNCVKTLQYFNNTNFRQNIIDFISPKLITFFLQKTTGDKQEINNKNKNESKQ